MEEAHTTNTSPIQSTEHAPVEPKHEGAAEKNTFLAAISYLGPLVFVSYLVSKNDSFVKFHIKQGLVLLVGEIGLSFLGMLVWPLFPLTGLVKLCIFILIIIGFINSIQGKEKELPFVGSLSKYFTF